MANIENLKPKDSNQSREEAKKNGKKGGIASGKARRERKAMREQLEMLLKLPVKSEKTKKQIHDLGISDKEIDNQMALTISLYQEALKGNTKAYELIRDTLGEKIPDRLEINEPKINISFGDDD